MKTPKFSIGERVSSKKTGLPAIGVINSIITPKALCIAKGVFTPEEALNIHPRWTELYPNWLDNYVYMLLFDEPHKTMSFEEFCKDIPIHEHLKGAAIQHQCYQQACPTSIIIWYPEEDLESFDNE